MPTVNETWVRRVGLSKSTATVCGPASGREGEAVGLEPDGELEDGALLGRAEVVVAQQVAGHRFSSG